MELFTRPPPATFNRNSYGFRIADSLTQIDDEEVREQRRILESWFLEFPEGRSKEELKARINDSNNENLLRATLELVTSAILLRSGFDIYPDPELPHTSRVPDFLATSNGTELIVECTMAGESTASIGEEARRNAFLTNVNGLNVGDRSLTINSIIRTGPRTPPKSALQRWIDKDLVPALGDAYSTDRLFEWEGWRVHFGIIADKAWAGAPTIGMVSEWDDLTASKRIARRVRDKQSAYGDLERPFLLVLSTSGLYPFDREFADGLLGRYGAWRSGDTYAGTRLSAVLYVSHYGPRNLLIDEWVLAHHPDPVYGLDDEGFPFARKVRWEGSVAKESPPSVSFPEFMRSESP